MLKELNLVSKNSFIDLKISLKENFSIKNGIFTTVNTLILRKFAKI